MNKKLMTNTYLGADFSDGIKHWKYIKRERKNGRWVYYYEDKKMKNLQNKISDIDADAAQAEYAAKTFAEYKKYKDAGKLDEYKHWAGDPDENDINGYNFIKIKNKDGKEDPNGEYTEHYKSLDEAIKSNTKQAIQARKKQAKLKKELKTYKNSMSTKTREKVAKTLVKGLNAASYAIDVGKKLLKKLFG